MNQNKISMWKEELKERFKGIENTGLVEDLEELLTEEEDQLTQEVITRRCAEYIRKDEDLWGEITTSWPRREITTSWPGKNLTERRHSSKSLLIPSLCSVMPGEDYKEVRDYLVTYSDWFYRVKLKAADREAGSEKALLGKTQLGRRASYLATMDLIGKIEGVKGKPVIKKFKFMIEDFDRYDVVWFWKKTRGRPFPSHHLVELYKVITESPSTSGRRRKWIISEITTGKSSLILDKYSVTILYVKDSEEQKEYRYSDTGYPTDCCYIIVSCAHEGGAQAISYYYVTVYEKETPMEVAVSDALEKEVLRIITGADMDTIIGDRDIKLNFVTIKKPLWKRILSID